MDEGNGKEQEKRTAASPSNQLGFATAPIFILYKRRIVSD